MLGRPSGKGNLLGGPGLVISKVVGRVYKLRVLVVGVRIMRSLYYLLSI